MRIGIQSDTDATVTQALTHHLWMDVLFQHNAGMGMAACRELSVFTACASQSPGHDPHLPRESNFSCPLLACVLSFSIPPSPLFAFCSQIENIVL